MQNIANITNVNNGEYLLQLAMQQAQNAPNSSIFPNTNN